MEIKKQLSVFIENKPGNLLEFCSILEDEKINIIGMSITDAADHAVIRIVVDDHKKALHIFGNQGMMVIESSILLVHLANRPGELKRVAHIFSQAEVNIDYIYGSQTRENDGAILFIKVKESQKALELLKSELS